MRMTENFFADRSGPRTWNRVLDAIFIVRPNIIVGLIVQSLLYNWDLLMMFTLHQGTRSSKVGVQIQPSTHH